LTIEHRVVEGEPVAQIIRMAQESGCELVVMGTHGRGGLSRWFTSTVTEQVVFKAPCSVLIARSHGEQTSAENDSIQEPSTESPST
jgi:nucleotide-binding universal stress UspA family protein